MHMMSKALDLIAIIDTQCHISAYLELIGRCNLPFNIWYPEDLTRLLWILPMEA